MLSYPLIQTTSKPLKDTDIKKCVYCYEDFEQYIDRQDIIKYNGIYRQENEDKPICPGFNALVKCSTPNCTNRYCIWCITLHLNSFKVRAKKHNMNTKCLCGLPWGVYDI